MTDLINQIGMNEPIEQNEELYLEAPDDVILW